MAVGGRSLIRKPQFGTGNCFVDVLVLVACFVFEILVLALIITASHPAYYVMIDAPPSRVRPLTQCCSVQISGLFGLASLLLVFWRRQAGFSRGALTLLLVGGGQTGCTVSSTR